MITKYKKILGDVGAETQISVKIFYEKKKKGQGLFLSLLCEFNIVKLCVLKLFHKLHAS